MPPIYSVVSLISSSFLLALAQLSLHINQRLKHLTLFFLTKQEMNAADFKGLVSDQWHVGVVGTSDLSKKKVHAQPLMHIDLMSCNFAEEWFRLFCATATGAGSEPLPNDGLSFR